MFPSLSPRSPYTFDYGRRSSCSTVGSSPRSPLFSGVVSNGGGAVGWTEEEDDEEEILHIRNSASIAASLVDPATTFKPPPGFFPDVPVGLNKELYQSGSGYAFPPKFEPSQVQANLRPVLETRESTSTASSSSFNVNEPPSHFSDWGTSIAPSDSMVSLSLQTPSFDSASLTALSHLIPSPPILPPTPIQEIWKSRSTTHLHIAPFPPHPQTLLDSTLPLPIDSTPPAPRQETKVKNVLRRRSVPANLRSPLKRNEADLLGESGIDSPITIESSTGSNETVS